MRNLTIKRHKSFVGCACTDRVFIRDELAGTLTIDGVSCRKLGEVKNGKEVTFQIPDEEQRIFVIADEVSKDYCNASMVIPAGTQDVVLAGKHHFVLGSNPFRFDGQELTPDQKRKGKKGLLIWIGAIVVGAAIGVAVGLNNAQPKEETFTHGDFSVTLTDEFSASAVEDEYAAFESASVYIWTVREEKQDLSEEIDSLERYGEVLIEVNEWDIPLEKKQGLYCYEFTDKPLDQEIYYFAVCSESEDAYWVTYFSTPAENREVYQDDFIQWAKSIEVE